MATPKRKTRRTATALSIILLLISAGLIVVTSMNAERAIRAFFMNVTLKEKYDDSVSRREELMDEIVSLQDEIEVYSNYDEKVENLKNTFFENALLADTLAKQGEADFKVCYLTFDDGPYLLTEKFLDVLDEYDVKATFFTLAKEGYDETYERQIKSGHTLANHSYQHTIRTIYDDEDTLIRDFVNHRKFTESKFGYASRVLRFPGGSDQISYMGLSKSHVVGRIADEGYGYVDWDCTTEDGKMVLSPEEFTANVLNNTRDRNVLVVLMHDYSRNTCTALPDIIEGLQDQGYIFLPLFYESSAVRKD